MSKKSDTLNRLVDVVVDCCANAVDEAGTMSVTRADVIGKSKAANVLMTRTILVWILHHYGFTYDTAAMLLNRSTKAVRNIYNSDESYKAISPAYRLAKLDAIERCDAEIMV